MGFVNQQTQQKTVIFFGPGATKNVGDVPVCFLDPVEILFLDLHVFVLDPGAFF